MGMTTLIYGVIWEYGLNPDKSKEIYTSNEAAIANLPKADSWPPLSREMFSITRKDEEVSGGPDLAYWGRMIHFAASLKSVEYEWLEWKVKFEALLQELYWIEAYVHMKTEYTDTLSFEWGVDLRKWSTGEGEILPPKRELWTFEDLHKWE